MKGSWQDNDVLIVYTLYILYCGASLSIHQLPTLSYTPHSSTSNIMIYCSLHTAHIWIMRFEGVGLSYMLPLILHVSLPSSVHVQVTKTERAFQDYLSVAITKQSSLLKCTKIFTILCYSCIDLACVSNITLDCFLAW